MPLAFDFIVLALLAASASPLTAPRAAGPTLDGVISDDEWANAQRIERDGQTVLLLRDDHRLFVGVRSPEEFVITTICIRDGDRVRIVHASAALGEAVYRFDGETWRIASTPESWARFGEDADALPALQDAFYAAHGWTGSHAHMGADSDTELAIALDALVDEAGAENPMAVVLYAPAREAADSRVLLTLPANLDDAAISHGINAGFWPDAAAFEPGSWATIEVGD